MDEKQGGALPEGIAAVDEFVGPSLEAAFDWHLSSRDPSFELVETWYSVRLTEYDEGGKGTKNVASVRFGSGLSPEASLVGLTRESVLGGTAREFGCENIEQSSDGDDSVGPSHVDFAIDVHAESSGLLVLDRHKEGIERSAIDEAERSVRSQNAKSQRRGIGRCAVRELSWPASEAAADEIGAGLQSVATRIDQGRRETLASQSLEQIERMKDPVADPRSTRIERDVARSKSANQTSLQIFDVLFAHEPRLASLRVEESYFGELVVVRAIQALVDDAPTRSFAFLLLFDRSTLQHRLSLSVPKKRKRGW